MRSTFAAAALLIVLAVVAACGDSSGPPPSQSDGTAAAPTGSFPLRPVPGNSVVLRLPSDAPAKVRALPALKSCGSEVLFSEDADITPIPTAPGPTTNPTDNQLAADCLLAAWESGTAAELVVSEISDEADEILSIYRLPGNGTLQLVVRVLSHADRTVSWTQRICRQLSIQEGTLTPADCDIETAIR
jgi:hypothetical protein